MESLMGLFINANQELRFQPRSGEIVLELYLANGDFNLKG
jgi:hypothetical protein